MRLMFVEKKFFSDFLDLILIKITSYSKAGMKIVRKRLTIKMDAAFKLTPSLRGSETIVYYGVGTLLDQWYKNVSSL